MSKIEEFNELAKGSVAKILDHYYKQGKEVPIDVINNIDFSEEITKKFEYSFTRHDRIHKIQETNIINCMRTLDFNAYAKYMNSGWIYNRGPDGDMNFIWSAISCSRTEALNRAAEIVKEEINNSTLIGDLGNRDLENRYFGQALDLERMLSQNQTMKEGTTKALEKYEFFKKSMELFSEYYSKRARAWKSTNEIDFLNWHKNYHKISIICNPNMGRVEELNKLLVVDKSLIKILKDVYNQYEPKDNPFFDISLMALGMRSNNLEFLQMLHKSGVPRESFEYAYNLNANETIDMFTRTCENSFSESIILPSYKNIKNINNFFEKNKIEVNHNKRAILSILISDKEEALDYLKAKENIEKIKVLDDLSLSQLSFLNKYLPNLLKSTKDEVSNEKEAFTNLYPTSELYFTFKSQEAFPNPVLTYEEKCAAVDIVLENMERYLPHAMSLSKQQVTAILTKELLTDSLTTDNEIKQKKNKI